MKRYGISANPAAGIVAHIDALQSNDGKGRRSPFTGYAAGAPGSSAKKPAVIVDAFAMARIRCL